MNEEEKKSLSGAMPPQLPSVLLKGKLNRAQRIAACLAFAPVVGKISYWFLFWFFFISSAFLPASVLHYSVPEKYSILIQQSIVAFFEIIPAGLFSWGMFLSRRTAKRDNVYPRKVWISFVINACVLVTLCNFLFVGTLVGCVALALLFWNRDFRKMRLNGQNGQGPVSNGAKQSKVIKPRDGVAVVITVVLYSITGFLSMLDLLVFFGSQVTGCEQRTINFMEAASLICLALVIVGIIIAKRKWLIFALIPVVLANIAFLLLALLLQLTLNHPSGI